MCSLRSYHLNNVAAKATPQLSTLNSQFSTFNFVQMRNKGEFMNIVVIDDDKLVALSLKTILESTGSITVAAMGSSGEEAIELYRQHCP